MHDEPLPFDLTLAREVFKNVAHLHGAATRRAAAALTPADFDRLRAADAEYVAALKAGRVQDAIGADDAFHRVLLEACDDPDVQVSVALLLPRLHRMDLWIFTRKAIGPSTNTHPEIVAALEAGDGETAARLVEASYSEAGDALAAAVERGGR
jgi:DNA-binding GntR family transcriptional regulator